MNRILSFFLVLFLAIFSSCSNPFTMRDSGRTVEFSLNAQFQVDLTGNPSTGYIWQVSQYDDHVIRQIGEPKFEVKDKKIGSPGVYTFTFETIAPGQTTLELVYTRKFEPGTEAAKTFKLDIISGTMGRIEAD
ncbi:MAG: protease inhibitor I42 family protein [Bacteroidota bacterium]|nr:protease inhibitor I42 family protein [Bacteroidota bacterium]